MTRILRLLQVKTVRSAWMFLIGSGLLFLFGAYQVFTTPAYAPEEPQASFVLVTFSFWFLISGAYLAIGSWALFSEEGRSYLEEQEQLTEKGSRGVIWFLKFLFSCYAAALATIIMLSVIALALLGSEGFEPMLSPHRGLYLLSAGLVWSPLIFRYLK